jgi:hypothetical protein
VFQFLKCLTCKKGIFKKIALNVWHFERFRFKNFQIKKQIQNEERKYIKQKKTYLLLGRMHRPRWHLMTHVDCVEYRIHGGTYFWSVICQETFGPCYQKLWLRKLSTYRSLIARGWLASAIEALSHEEFTLTAVSLCAIWYARRKAVYEEVFQSPLSTLSFINWFCADL